MDNDFQDNMDSLNNKHSLNAQLSHGTINSVMTQNDDLSADKYPQTAAKYLAHLEKKYKQQKDKY